MGIDEFFIERFERIEIQIRDLSIEIESLENSNISLLDYIKDLEKILLKITSQDLYEKFEYCWDTIKERDLIFTENIYKVNLMINEFKGLVSMSRADFRSNQKFK